DFGFADKVAFTGFIEDGVMNALYKVSDVVAVPSRYEPFGVVALEAMAAETPVVVADTGGLSEIIEQEKDGIKVWPNHSESLSWGINRVLLDTGLADYIRKNAKEKIKNMYTWSVVSKNTNELYGRISEEYKNADWKAVKFVSANQ
ncbi:MAG: glycosyltransferase family 4 protein, partial [Candidatus Aenigmarchaeota archaeon]|nr:glycosyltransferase family 4 protein [Candidatus Aenigmarchaeota archaeon]